MAAAATTTTPHFVTSFGLPDVLALGGQPDDVEVVVVSPQAAPGTNCYTGTRAALIDVLLEEMPDTFASRPAGRLSPLVVPAG